jgi:dihydroflavonol-4-reductase
MWSQAQCLVTGGTGFIGRYVVRALLERGAKVRLLVRSPEKAHRLFGNQVEFGNECRGINVVFHLAGTYRFGRRAAGEMFETNVRFTERLLDSAWRAHVERFVHISSSGVLSSNGVLITESSFPRDVSPREPYRHTKWLGELAALAMAKRGLPVVIGSPTAPLGAEDEVPTPTGRIVRDFVAGKFPFSTRTAINFVDVAELADGILALAEHGRIGERYILGHHNIWLTDFLQILERCANRPAPRRELPWPVIAAAGSIGELAGTSRVCWETARGARKRQFFDLRKATDELAWQPHRLLEASAREAVNWFERRPARGPLILAETNVAVS